MCFALIFNTHTHTHTQVSAVCREHGAEIFLDKDARKWSKKLADNNKAIAEKQKSVKGLQSVTQAYTKVSTGGTPHSHLT